MCVHPSVCDIPLKNIEKEKRELLKSFLTASKGHTCKHASNQASKIISKYVHKQASNQASMQATKQPSTWMLEGIYCQVTGTGTGIGDGK